MDSHQLCKSFECAEMVILVSQKKVERELHIFSSQLDTLRVAKYVVLRLLPVRCYVLERCDL